MKVSRVYVFSPAPAAGADEAAGFEGSVATGATEVGLASAAAAEVGLAAEGLGASAEGLGASAVGLGDTAVAVGLEAAAEEGIGPLEGPGLVASGLTH